MNFKFLFAFVVLCVVALNSVHGDPEADPGRRGYGGRGGGYGGRGGGYGGRGGGYGGRGGGYGGRGGYGGGHGGYRG